jgi:hypothetical protein
MCQRVFLRIGGGPSPVTSDATALRDLADLAVPTCPTDFTVNRRTACSAERVPLFPSSLSSGTGQGYTSPGIR